MDILTSKNFKEGTNDPPKKRRKRVSLTCTSCKQRKVKCDQGKPCSSCVKKRIPAHLCIYEDSPFIPTPSESTNPTETIVLLKDENAKLKEELDELKKWKEIVSGEPMPGPSICQTQLFQSITVKKNRVVYLGPTSWRTFLDKEQTYADLVKSAKNYISNVKKEWKVDNNLNHFPYEEYKDINVETPQKLLRNLEKYLPDYETIKKYLRNYGEGYWNYKLPIVDPELLLLDFNKLFFKTQSGFEIRSFEKTIDFAKIALIVVIVKHVITNINSSDKDSNYDSRDHLLRYAERLLQLSKYEYKSSIPALQTMILLRTFRKMNPIDGDNGDSSAGALLHRAAINMAIMMGLHRNIDAIYVRSSVVARNVMKNIWSHLFFQDAVLSFHLGVPLALDEKYVDPSYLEQDSSIVHLGNSLRKAVKVLTKRNSCGQHEILQVIEDIENHQNGLWLKLSKSVRSFTSADKILNDYDLMSETELSLFGIYTLHVLYDVLYRGVEANNPNVDAYYNGAMKYGSLCATHFIEILFRLNRFCVENKPDPDKLYKIVEVCLSIVGASKITFIKIFSAICSYEVVQLFESDLNSTHPSKLTFDMNVEDFESLNPYDFNHHLNKSFRSPAFLHGLITLACQYMMKMKNDSFQRVFNLNFCLFVVLALFKYFEKFIERKLHKEKVKSSLDKIKTSVSYTCDPSKSVFANPENSNQSTDNSTKAGKNTENLISPESRYTGSDQGSIQSTTPNSANYSIPSNGYMTEALAFGSLDPIDELFKNVFADDNFLNAQFDTNMNWELNDFLTNGTGLFYENKNHQQHQGSQTPNENLTPNQDQI